MRGRAAVTAGETTTMAADHNSFANLIWQIADLLRGPYRPPQYERVMLPMTVLRRFDCVLAETKAKVVAAHGKHKGGKLAGDALDTTLNKVAGQRFHNHSSLDFEKLKGDPDNINKHLVSYIKGFSTNVQRIFEYFEFEAEIEKMHEANILYLVVSKFADVDLHPSNVANEQMGLIFENLIRRFNELANETAGDQGRATRRAAKGRPRRVGEGDGPSQLFSRHPIQAVLDAYAEIALWVQRSTQYLDRAKRSSQPRPMGGLSPTPSSTAPPS
jgi:hypothetical protein